MRVLLDECVPERLRRHLGDREIHSVRYAGLSGSSNGELLRLAEQAGYQVLVTVDHGIPYQHNLSGRRIGVIVLRAPGNDIETLKQMKEAIVRALTAIPEGAVIELDYSATCQE